MALYPLKKKKRSKPKTQKPPPERAPKKSSSPKKPKQKLTLNAVTEYIRFGTNGLKKMLRRLVLSNLTCHLLIAGEDAAKTALLYGRISSAISLIYPMLEDVFRIRKSDIFLDIDFEKKKSELLADVTIAACPLRLLAAAVVLLVQFLKVRKTVQRSTQTTIQEGGNLNEQHQ